MTPAAPSARIELFVEGCLEAFEEACASTPPEHRQLSVADRAVSIDFRSPQVAERYQRATASMEAPSDACASQPALEIFCWDTESTGVGLPPMPWQATNLLPGDRVQGHTTGDVR